MNWVKQYFRIQIAACALLAVSIFSSESTFAQSSVSCTTATHYQYAPSQGRTNITADQYSRYVWVWMYWHTDDRLNWFRRLYAPGTNFSAGTFELQTIFYNYDGHAYGNAPYGYWDTNLPAPYVDTQFEDSSNEKDITIGSADAVQFFSATWYYYVTRFTNGGGSSSWVKVQSQRGVRTPTSCYSTWCSFGCSTADNYYNHIPFQAHKTAPGCYDYTAWPGGINNISSCPPF